MTISQLVFIVAIFGTFFVFAILWYAQFSTYREFKWLPEDVFISFHKKYVNNLWLSTYGPSIVYLISTFLLLFLRPDYVPATFPIILNILNLLAVIFTFALAVPVHIRIDREAKYTMGDLDKLLLYNALRLGCLLVNSILVIYLLAILLIRTHIA